MGKLDQTIINKMNRWGSAKIPFLFIIDFESLKPVVFRLDEVPQGVLFKINRKKNYRHKTIKKKLDFNVIKSSLEDYEKSFDQIQKEIDRGNTYLINLCTRTEIKMNYSLKDVFFAAEAKYKLYFDLNGEKFTVFSPEIFVQIRKSRIYTHPMKGTIDADLENAKNLLLENPKEKAEHFTIVDLLRNDLSIVSKKVKVKKYRYLDSLKTNQKNLLQTSSKISGKLPKDYAKNIGTIVSSLLPAGSICGAPKKKTVEIIKSIENIDRGYYTGIMGCFDGERLDAGIMIRYMEQIQDKFYYRSGGGITFSSDCQEEYEELNHKIYVPINRKY